MVPTDNSANSATQKSWYSYLKASHCLPCVFRQNTTTVCPDVYPCASLAYPINPEADCTHPQVAADQNDRGLRAGRKDAPGLQASPQLVNACPPPVSSPLPVDMVTNIVSVDPGLKLAAPSPVKVQDMSSRALTDHAVYLQITCPQCAHMFPYRLPTEEKAPLASSVSTFPLAVAVSTCCCHLDEDICMGCSWSTCGHSFACAPSSGGQWKPR